MASRQWIVAIVIVGVAAVVTWYIWSKGPRTRSSGGGTGEPEGGRAVQEIGPVKQPVRPGPTTRPAATTRPAPATRPIRPEPTLSEAQKAMKRGLDLIQAGKYVPARAALAAALNSGKLSQADAETVRAKLAALADETIFSPRVYQDDPYALSYTFKRGEYLQTVEVRERLHVPWQLLLRINGIRRAEDIRAGQTVKFIRGPFHAVVYKSQFVMDVYLHDTFVRRFRIAIGKPATPTPTGFFRVKRGGKLLNARYTPPPGSGRIQKSIPPGHPDYPLDANGHWIALTGIPEKGTKLTAENGYGIHGTNNPSSIGKAISHGCIRLSDRDIETVFSMLYEQWSMVRIVE